MAHSVQSHQWEARKGDDYQRDDDWQDNACKRRKTSFCCSPLPWHFCTWVRGTTSISCHIPFTKRHWFPQLTSSTHSTPWCWFHPREDLGDLQVGEWGFTICPGGISHPDLYPHRSPLGLITPQRLLWNCPATGTIFWCTQRFLVFFFFFGKRDCSEIQRLRLLFLF